MRNRFRLLAPVLAFVAASPTCAAPVVHDAASLFATYAGGTRIRPALNNPSFRGTQGQQRNGSAVPGGRSDIDSLFPASSLFYALGIGANRDPRVTAPTVSTAGTLSLTISPGTGRRITAASLNEVTFTGGDRHAEAAWVFLGTEANPFGSLAGLIWNEDANLGAAGAWNAGTFATLAAANQPGGDGGAFTLNVTDGAFTTLSVLDASRTDLTLPGLGRNLSTFSTSQDGFDIDSLSMTSDVAEPGALALFGLGLLGLRWARHRRSHRESRASKR